MVSPVYTVFVSVFLATMVNLAMRRKLFAELSVLVRFIGHKVRLSGDIGADDRRKIILLDAFDVERAGASLTLNEGENWVLMAVSAADGLAFLAADESFVGFNWSSGTTHGRKIALSHRLADSMAEEPRGLHAARQHPLDLVGRNAFLAGAHQVDDLQPKMQRQDARLSKTVPGER